MRGSLRRPFLRLLVVPVVLGLLAAACGGGGGGDAGQSGKRTVRLAESIPALSFAPLLVARDKDLFKQQGVDVQYTQLESGATALQALLGGSIDMVNSASTEVAAATSTRCSARPSRSPARTRIW
jgi:NitT/TauT family transport system substrate-binding protein